MNLTTNKLYGSRGAAQSHNQVSLDLRIRYVINTLPNSFRLSNYWTYIPASPFFHQTCSLIISAATSTAFSTYATQRVNQASSPAFNPRKLCRKISMLDYPSLNSGTCTDNKVKVIIKVKLPSVTFAKNIITRFVPV